MTQTGHAPVRPVDVGVQKARNATAVSFFGAGFAFASWASCIPQVRAGLHLDPGALGLLLLTIAAGSVLALPLSGPLVARIGSRRTVRAMALLLTVALLVVGIGFLAGTAPVAVGLFLLGFANGAWDVAMNVQGAGVERRLGRSILARFHAAFSLGTVAGALLGAVLIAVDVPVTAHLVAVAVLVLTAVPAAVQRFLPDIDESEPAPAGPALRAWREPRTLLVGLFVLAFAFAEGSGNDWISLAVIDGYHLPAALGTLAFAVFLAAMTLGRWVGPPMLDRHGRVPVVRALAVTATGGLMLFVFAPVAGLAFAGALLWGLGTSLGFPVGMSAGADDPARAAGRVSVVASIGYCAFLGGPPVIGLLGDHLGVLRALVVVGGLLVVAVGLAPAVAPPRQAERGR